MTTRWDCATSCNCIDNIWEFWLAINTFLSPAERGLCPQPLKRMKPAEPLVNKDLSNSSENNKTNKQTNITVHWKIYKKIQHGLKTCFKVARNHLILLTLDYYYYIFNLSPLSPWYTIILAVNSWAWLFKLCLIHISF